MSITTLNICNVFFKGKPSSELILVFIHLWEETSEMLIFNKTEYLILSSFISYFSSDLNNSRYLVLPYFLMNPSSLSKALCKVVAPVAASFVLFSYDVS